MTMKRYSGLKFFTLLLCIVGCTTMCDSSHEDMNPEQVVEAYLTEAFNIQDVSEVDNIIQYTTDNLKKELEKADTNKITEMFISKRYNLDNFLVVEKSQKTPREIEVTYELSYQELSASTDEGRAANQTIENTFALVRKKGKWFISDVFGGDTNIDFQTPTKLIPCSKSSELTEEDCKD